MNVGQEVKIPIDESFTGPVCDYSVGFLRFKVANQIETAEPAGTGTFVKLGEVYGILTAGHVLQPMQQGETVGLVRFPSIEPVLQNYRLDLNHTERVVKWSGQNCEAPDIAFLKIPTIDGRNLEAIGAVFYNLAIPRDFRVSKPEHKMSKCSAIVGVVGEWTEEVDKGANPGKKIEVGGLFGAATNLREFKEGDADLVEVEIDHSSGPRIPKSYGGVSGGAAWELHVELDEKNKPVRVNKVLRGVAFRESQDRRKITCNDKSVVDALADTIAQNWP
ncbi:hypothetical protein V1291_004822 [Nitrobacteraceae bacterium AZCC 1564]